MARIFITGSADGLGHAAARRLVALGHEVVLHGRNRDRAQQTLRAVPGARTALEDDLASMEQTRELAARALPVDSAHRITSAADLSDVGPAPGRRPGSSRPGMAPTALQRSSGLRQLKTVRYRAGLRRRPPLAARPLECRRSWMGSHEDGRRVRTRR